MAKNSKIEWCDHTFNPWVGCTRLSPACDHCYAEHWARRTGHPELWTGERRRTTEAYWRQPLKWNRAAKEAGVRAKVFCASLADVFDNQVPDDWRADLWELIRETPDLDWLILTKRPQNAGRMIVRARKALMGGRIADEYFVRPWSNVWLGTTVENQEEADRRIPHLLAVPAVKRFLSCEPLLGALDLRSVDVHDGLRANVLVRHVDHVLGSPLTPAARIDWVICGGESGPNARPMHPDWARSLRDQCASAGVPFFLKQWGEWVPVDEWNPRYSHKELAIAPDGSQLLSPCVVPQDVGGHRFRKVGKKAGGAELDGREWREFP